MITVNIEIIDHPFDYELELQCLPAKGDTFLFYIDEDDPDFTDTTVEQVEHYHSDEEGHVIWITLSKNKEASQ